MKMFQRLLVLGLLICGTAYLAGCGEQKPADNGGGGDNSATTTDTGSSDADHDDADHDDADADGSGDKDGGTAATSNSDEYQLVSLKLPNMT